MQFRYLAVLASFICFSSGISESRKITDTLTTSNYSYYSDTIIWVDTLLKSLTPEERIGQLFMISAYSNKTSAHKAEVARLISTYNIGGLIFMKGGPVRQVGLTNHYQSIAKVPLLIGMDAEWGLSMRLDSTPNFPRQLMLGAIQDNELIYKMGKEIARQCKRMGVHISFAPVVDVNNNPDNPVINDRSFGENKHNVAAKSISYMRGLQDGGVLACAKHFPGHGDTDKDSHETLPTIHHSKERLDSLELYPFREMIKAGVSSIMTAHLYIPSLDSTKNSAASISKNVITDLLIKELQFKGLIFTDALNMKGVTNYYSTRALMIKALKAGNDILLFPENIPAAVESIKKALKDGEITQAEIDHRVKKILQAKYHAGLHEYKPTKIANLLSEINTPQATLINRQLIESSLTLVHNTDALIPFQLLDTLNFASVSIGSRVVTDFQRSLGNYAPFTHYPISKQANKSKLETLIKELKEHKVVVVGIHNMSRFSSRNYGINKNILWFLEEIAKNSKVIITVFGNPYSLRYFNDAKWLLMSYENDQFSQSLSAQLLFGGISANGKLPVTASKDCNYGKGANTIPPIRLKYSIPEEVGIASRDLLKIDSIALEAIEDKATPGCQILVAKDGKVIYQKSFGFHTYDKKRAVKNTDLYDLASITKMTATLISLMRLYDLRLLDVKENLEHYLPDLDETNKKKLVIRDILAHQAGLKDWIPFYLHTLNKDGSYDSNYCDTSNSNFSIRVTNNLYLHKDYPKVMWKEILESRIKNKGKYRYSDLGFYFLKKLIEDLNQQPLDTYVQENFYVPLGLATMCYNPWQYFPLERIVPTEDDKTYRKGLVHGDVHDMGAAMLGGVGGHAGLFSNANDLAIFMQMLMNNGTYGGDQFFKKGTIPTFAAKQFKNNRRGMGFDKPEKDPDEEGPTCKSASANTFGHTGFTGTAAWADPDNQLIFIFLSNRIHPDINNRKLIENDIRTRIQQIIYDAIANGSTVKK